jgi:site-specific DNA-adenine methylase
VESILKYDSPDTFIYLDPPYFSLDSSGNDTAKRSGWYGTKEEFDQKQHIRLLELLPTLKSKWMLSTITFQS